MEDTLRLRKGELAPSYEPLDSRLASVCRSLDRQLATVEQTEQILGPRADPGLAA